MIVVSNDRLLLTRFNALRAELADLAFELECQGRCDAADITNHLSGRLAEIAGEFSERPAAFSSQLESHSS